MFKKYLAVFMAAMMILMVVPAMANEQVNDPEIIQHVSVMGVGYTWNFGPSEGTSMLNNSYFSGSPTNPHTEYIIFNDQFTVDGIDYLTHTQTGVTYVVDYTYINLRTFDYVSDNSVPSAVNYLVENFDGELLIVDMFYSDIMNVREHRFYVASDHSDATRSVSVFANNGSTSFAPSSFDFRDLLLQSPPSNFADAFDEGLFISGATPFVATWPQFNTILSYALPQV